MILSKMNRIRAILYTIICFPSWMAFCQYSRKNELIVEDFNRWCKEFKRLSNCSEFSAFRTMMTEYPEYRFQLYYRLPFLTRHLLTILLRPCNNLYIDTLSVGEGHDYNSWLLHYYLC